MPIVLDKGYQIAIGFSPATMAKREESKRQWITGLAITLTTLVCLFGFWHLAPTTTFVIAVVALVALVILFWFAGKAHDNG